MSKKLGILLMSLSLAFMLFLTGCGQGAEKDKESSESKQEESQQAQASESKEEEASEVEITDAKGNKVMVKKNPEKVISLDNRTFETLSDWGVKLQAVPKDVMPPNDKYVKDDSVKNIGNHREPNLELIAAADPELVIVGQRFARHEKAIRELVPNATVIDLNFDVSKDAEKPGENLVSGLKNSTEALGKIFGKEEEAKKLIEEFDTGLKKAKAAYPQGKKVMAVNVSGGEIGFIAPKFGRFFGPLYDVMGWEPAIVVEGSSADHKGDKISVEAIAESNPDWLLVLDRDAATQQKKGKESPLAKDVIENSPALAGVEAIKSGNVVYAPADTYTNESIQTFIEVFNSLAESFSKAK